jgi:hypothetical protein
MSKIRRGLKNPDKVFRYIIMPRIRSVVRPIDRFIGVRLFDGTTRFSAHMNGNLEKKGKSGISEVSISDSAKDAGDQLDNKGYYHLGKQCDEDTVQSIRKKFDSLLNKKDLDFTSTGPDGVDYRRGVRTRDRSFASEFPEIKELVTDKINDVLLGHYDSWYKPTSIRIWRNKHVPSSIESEVFSDYWHIDEGTDTSTAEVKLFILLSDVDENCGPFQAVPMDATHKIQRQWDNFTNPRHVPKGPVEANTDEIFEFTGPMGSAAFCRTTTNLHRASNPAEGKERDMIQIYFAPGDEPLDENWLEQYDL